MKLNKFAAVLAASSMLASGAAMAEPFYLVAPNGGAGNDADPNTAITYQFGVDYEPHRPTPIVTAAMTGRIAAS